MKADTMLSASPVSNSPPEISPSSLRSSWSSSSSRALHVDSLSGVVVRLRDESEQLDASGVGDDESQSAEPHTAVVHNKAQTQATKKKKKPSFPAGAMMHDIVEINYTNSVCDYFPISIKALLCCCFRIAGGLGGNWFP